jgi:long-subunit acyl-CoA synthetase (AMP-forming)
MRTLFDAMARHARDMGDAVAISDDRGAHSRRDLLARVVGLAAELRPKPRIMGLFAPNGLDWAIAQLACALAGKIVVPLPTFFSAVQLAHIVQDASVELILATDDTWPRALQSGVNAQLIKARPADGGLPEPAGGFGQVIYTSGSTGQPKGVRHETGQIGWSTEALASVTGASAHDTYLSVLPLPLLLETICAVFVPALVGARVHFETELAEAVGRGGACRLAPAFETYRPTMSVVVPQLLQIWAAELLANGRRAPASLRFVAVGGAPVPPQVARTAWSLGIPAHEGYGLSECCSVVAVNRFGERRAGTVGRPLHGLDVSIDDGEIIVDGPSITDGYLGCQAALRPWRTGDLGAIDAEGFLTVHGRKDNQIVTAFGRNISPEWIETMLLDDPRILFCAVTGHGEPRLTALLIPSREGADWFAKASDEDVLNLISGRCSAAPEYAVPGAYMIISLDEAVKNQLLGGGRIRRKQVAEFVETKVPRPLAAVL